MLHFLSKHFFHNRPNSCKMKQEISETISQAYFQLRQAYCLNKTQLQRINQYFHYLFSYTRHDKFWVFLIFLSVLLLVLIVDKCSILQHFWKQHRILIREIVTSMNLVKTLFLKGLKILNTKLLISRGLINISINIIKNLNSFISDREKR